MGLYEASTDIDIAAASGNIVNSGTVYARAGQEVDVTATTGNEVHFTAPSTPGSLVDLLIQECYPLGHKPQKGQPSVIQNGTGTQNQQYLIQDSTITLDVSPNPFIDYFKCSFVVNESLPVKVDLYNSMGVLVKTLMDNQNVSGLHVITFRTSDLSPDFYFVHVTAGNQSFVMG
ncbi:MAG: T9SS type A sorting domain-containing protein [Bacteroidia bacterium]